MTQEIITYLIIVLAILKVLYSVYETFFSKKKKPACSCGNSGACSPQDWHTVKQQSKIYAHKLINIDE